jgi:hypothetical protein
MLLMPKRPSRFLSSGLPFRQCQYEMVSVAFIATVLWREMFFWRQGYLHETHQDISMGSVRLSEAANGVATHADTGRDTGIDLCLILLRDPKLGIAGRACHAFRVGTVGLQFVHAEGGTIDVSQ